MPREKLWVFVSGKEGELDDERDIAIETIKVFFDPLASEDRAASEQSITDEYLGEVNEADIYIGIFGKIYSEPSRREFDTARANNIPVLVFEKQLKDDKRDKELEEFLGEVQNPLSGITADKYSDVVDFREKLKKALSILISRKFKKAREFEKQKVVEGRQIESAVAETKEEKQVHSFEAGNATFMTFRFPDRIKRGESADVFAEIKGSVKNGFLDLLIIDPDGSQKWYPDPRSWNSALDKGELQLRDAPYSSSWQFNISEKRKLGKYKAILVVLQDVPSSPTPSRQVVAEQQREFEVH